MRARTMPSAVVVGVGWATGVSAIRSLGRAGVEVLAVDHRAGALGFRSRHARPVLSPDRVRDPNGFVSFLERLGDALAGARAGSQVAVLFCDLDLFKQVNDTFGHPQGDEVLIGVAGVLRDRARDIDEPARWGGEEFAVVLPQTDLDGAYIIAERMRKHIEDLRVPRPGVEGVLQVTASFGVASVPQNADDREELFEAAFKALSRAKRLGKNRVERAGDDAEDGPLT